MPQISHLYTVNEMNKVSIKLETVEIVNTTSNQQNIETVKPVFTITNPTSTQFSLIGVNYSLFANDVYVGNSTISFDDTLGIGGCGCWLFANTTRQIISPTVDLKDSSVIDGEKLAMNNGSISWQTKGSYRLDTKDYSGIVSFTDTLDDIS